MVRVCERKACKAALQGGGGAAKLADQLHKALEHAAGLLHETAVDETQVGWGERMHAEDADVSYTVNAPIRGRIVHPNVLAHYWHQVLHQHLSANACE
jgi:hypothetical protein